MASEGVSMPMRRRICGFTLLELMFVMAIMSILLVIALPFYLGYQTRAKVGEGMSLFPPFKNGVAEYYLTAGNWPINNSEAGLGDPSSHKGNYVSSITIVGDDPGRRVVAVVIEYDSNAISALASKNQITFIPTYVNGGFQWECRSTDGLPRQVESYYRPAPCRM